MRTICHFVLNLNFINQYQKKFNLTNFKKRFNSTFFVKIYQLIFVALVMTLCTSRANAQQYIDEWLVLGSFPVQNEQDPMKTAFVKDETGIYPHGGLKTAGRRWRHYQTPVPYLNFLDLTLDLFPLESAVAYAHFYIKSSQADTVAMTVGYDDMATLRINGEMIWQSTEKRLHEFDQDTIPIPLKKGWNRALFKITNSVGEWALSARFLNRDGLIVQAAIPSLPKTIRRPDPQLVRIRKIEPADQAIFTQQNKPTLQLRTILYNPQKRPLEKCQAQLYARSGKAVGKEQTFKLRAGELRSIYFNVPVSAILQSFQASGAWQLRLKYRNEEYRRIVPFRYDSRLLNKLFGSFEVLDIESFSTNGTQGFRRVIYVPKEWADMPLYLSVDVGESMGKVHVNSEEKVFNLQGLSGDILLSDKAEAGKRYEVSIYFESAVHAQNGVAHLPDSLGNKDEIITPKVYLTVENLALRRYLTNTARNGQAEGNTIDERKEVDNKIFSYLKSNETETLNQLIDEKNTELSELPVPVIRTPDVSLIGHSHIAFGNQENYSACFEKCRSVFNQATKNFNKYPGFYFSQNQVFSYWAIEQRDPQLYKAIQSAIANKHLEPVGGSWVECDLNIPSGESLARQFLYGKRYLKEKFDVIPDVAWMVKSHGHSANLPQILKKSGFKAYLFYQPYESSKLFEWEGLDGSRIASYRPVESHDSRLNANVGRHALAAEQRFDWPKALRLYSAADNGHSGAERDIRMAEDLAYVTADRSQRSSVPSVRMAPTRGFFDELDSTYAFSDEYNGEITSDQTGSWSSHPHYKWLNRQVESVLPIAEMFSLFAEQFGFEYPQDEFTTLWRRVLFNQAYDLLSGIGTKGIYTDTERIYYEAEETAKAAMDKAMTWLETYINTHSSSKKEAAFIVYNPSNWQRTDYVEIEATVAFDQKISKTKRRQQKVNLAKWPYFRDSNGSRLPAQILKRDSTNTGIHYRLLFLPENVSAMGYQVYWLGWSDEQPEVADRIRINETSLAMSNKHFSIKIDSTFGGLARLVDSELSREWMHSDKGGFHILGEQKGSRANSAIAYDSTAKRLRLWQRPEIIEQGELRGKIRMRYAYKNSEIVQDYVLYAGARRIEMHFFIHWKEPYKMLKLVYPFYIPDQQATFETPFGAVTRPTNGREIPMQKWLDLSNKQFGVSVLNDGKYGVDVDQATVGISALRSPAESDSLMNTIDHQFSLAIVPHIGDWKDANITRASHEINRRLIVRSVRKHKGKLPPRHSFAAVSSPQVILSALKKSEDDKSWIMRIYESTGSPAAAMINLPFAPQTVSEVNMIEWDEKPLAVSGQEFMIHLSPWEVKTLKIK